MKDHMTFVVKEIQSLRNFLESLNLDLGRRGYAISKLTDLGYSFSYHVTKVGYRFYLMFGPVADPQADSKDPKMQQQYLISVESELGFLSRLRGRTDSVALQSLVATISECIQQELHVDDVRFYTKKEWECISDDSWTRQPS